jgi:hypothetical protein
VFRNDVGEFDEITFKIEILAPDLTIKDVNIYNETDEKIDSFGEGEIIKNKNSLTAKYLRGAKKD